MERRLSESFYSAVKRKKTARSIETRSMREQEVTQLKSQSDFEITDLHELAVSEYQNRASGLRRDRRSVKIRFADGRPSRGSAAKFISFPLVIISLPERDIANRI